MKGIRPSRGCSGLQLVLLYSRISTTERSVSVRSKRAVRFDYIVDGAGYVLFALYVSAFFAIFSDSITPRKFLILILVALGTGFYAAVGWYLTRCSRKSSMSRSWGQSKLGRIRYALGFGVLLLLVLEVAAVLRATPFFLIITFPVTGGVILATIYLLCLKLRLSFESVGWKW